MFVNTIQDAKSKAVKTMITDEKVREPFQSFIDAQTAFAQEVFKIADSVYPQVNEQMLKFTGKK